MVKMYLFKKRFNKIIEHLCEQYPFMKGKYTFPATIKSWLRKSEHRSVVIYLIRVIQRYLTDKKTMADILSSMPTNAFSNKRKKIYQIYMEHKIEDFGMIKSAAEFYGKSINDFSKEIMQLFDTDYVPMNIQSELNIFKDLMHIITCITLMMMGLVFYHFRISIILESSTASYHNFVKDTVIEIIENNYTFDESIFDAYPELNYLIQNEKLNKSTCLSKITSEFSGLPPPHDDEYLFG